MFNAIIGGKIIKLIKHSDKVVAYDVQCTNGQVVTLSKEEILGYVARQQITNAQVQGKGTGVSIDVGKLKLSREAKPEEIFGGVFLSKSAVAYIENLVLKQGHTIMFPMMTRAVYIIEDILSPENVIQDLYLTNLVYGSGDKTSRMASILANKITSQNKNISELRLHISTLKSANGAIFLTKERFTVEDGYNTMDIKSLLLEALIPDKGQVGTAVFCNNTTQLELGANTSHLAERFAAESEVVAKIKRHLNGKGFYITNSPAGEKGYGTNIVYHHLKEILGEDLYRRAKIEVIFNCRLAFTNFFKDAGLRAAVLSYNPGKFMCRHNYESLAFWNDNITSAEAMYVEYLDRLKNAALVYMDLGQSKQSVFNSMISQASRAIGYFLINDMSPVYFMKDNDYIMYGCTSFDRMLGGLMPAIVFKEVVDPTTKSIRFKFVNGESVIGVPRKAPAVSKKLNELYSAIVKYDKSKSKNSIATIMNN